MNVLRRYGSFASHAARLRLASMDDVPIANVISSFKRAFHYSQRLSGSKRWTSEERDTLMKARQQNKTTTQISQLLPDRSELAIEGALRILRKTSGPELRYNKKADPLTAAERQILIHAKSEGMRLKEAAQLLPGRTLGQLEYYYHVAQLESSKPPAVHKRWSSAEDSELRHSREHLGLSFPEISKRIDGCSAKSAQSRYFRITKVAHRVKKAYRTAWSPDGIRELNDMLSRGMSRWEIAERTGRTAGAVKNKVYRLKYMGEEISSDERPARRWSADDIERLRTAVMERQPRVDVAKLLKRSVLAVNQKIHILGLSPSRRASPGSSTDTQQRSRIVI